MNVVTKNHTLLIAFSIITVVFSAVGAHAQVNPLAPTLATLSVLFNIVNVGISITVSLAFLYFFYNLGRYILSDQDKEGAKQKIGYSIIAIVVITSLWGIIAFVRLAFGIRPGPANDVMVPTAVFYN